MVAIQPVRRFGRVVQNRAARLAETFTMPVFLGRVVYHLLVDIVLRRKYLKTVARNVSDITIGVGALVIGGGMVFVVFSMSVATGAQVGLQGYPALQRIGVESFAGILAS